MTIYVDRLTTPIGDLAVAVNEESCLLRLEFLGGSSFQDFAESMHRMSDASPAVDSSRCAAVRRQLEEYFAGDRRAFDIELRPEGTAFQRRVWEELTRIPYGATRCYREIAEAIGSPTAFRAVGQANHRNPIPILIPCHRVVGADGSLTGFGGGLPVKRALLELEQGAGAMVQEVLFR